MSVTSSPVLAEDKVVLNILLNCEETKSSETKQVPFKSLPTTPLEIKKKIEEDFSIPSCVQTLHYQSMILKDSDQLQYTHIRSGDTFTVDYPIEAECEMVKTVIKWLKELLELLKPTADSHTDEDALEDLILEGENDKTVEALCYRLFTPWEDKKKLMNKFYFQYEGGLDVLMKVYRILVSKEWGDLGIDTEFHIYLERKCALAISNYPQTILLRRQVGQMGGLEMCTTTLLRRQLRGHQYYIPDTLFNTLFYSLCIVSNLSELPECQVPLAMKTDVIDQILAIALHPTYDCKMAYVSASIFLNLTQSPEAHTYIVRREVVEKMLGMCELKQKMVSEQTSQSRQGEKDDPIAVNALKGYTSIVLAQVGLGSPQLLFDHESIPPHLLHQILNLMSDTLEAASPAEIRQYEEKEKFEWGTFLPYLQYLYKPSTLETVLVENSNDGNDVRAKLYISCCNVLLNGLENALGRELHLEVLLKEGLLDYTMCLPAVLPGECQPRARSLVYEISKHRKLQPPRLCTLAKAHIAKMFCGLQPVMEMNSIGDFVHKYFCAS